MKTKCIISIFLLIFSVACSNNLTKRISIEIEPLRGNRFFCFSMSIDKKRYSGIYDICGKWAVPLSDNYFVMGSTSFGDDEGNPKSQFIGGKDSGIYWVYSGKCVAFLDVPSGYFSGFFFSECTDPYYWNDSSYLRVANDEGKYAYVNRSNGLMLTDYIFDQMNFMGFINGYAFEHVDNTNQYVVISETGDMMDLPQEIQFNLDSFCFIEENSMMSLFQLDTYDGTNYLLRIIRSTNSIELITGLRVK